VQSTCKALRSLTQKASIILYIRTTSKNEIFMSLEDLTNVLLDKLKLISQAETVIGDPIETGKFTIIPVSKVSVGFGVGGNTGKVELNGTGGGLQVEPVAFLVVSENDVRVLPVQKDSSTLQKVADLVPDVLTAFNK
jgi:uncharacterized spore protein YtfJ